MKSQTAPVRLTYKLLLEVVGRRSIVDLQDGASTGSPYHGNINGLDLDMDMHPRRGSDCKQAVELPTEGRRVAGQENEPGGSVRVRVDGKGLTGRVAVRRTATSVLKVDYKHRRSTVISECIPTLSRCHAISS